MLNFYSQHCVAGYETPFVTNNEVFCKRFTFKKDNYYRFQVIFLVSLSSVYLIE